MRNIVPHHALNIGAGMYGAGKGVEGTGTGRYGPLLSTHFQLVADGLETPDTIYCATSSTSATNLWEKSKELTDMFGFNENPVKLFFPEEGHDPCAYKDAATILRDPGFAVVSVPDPSHKDIIIDMLEAGKHVMSVKPLAGTLEDCLDILLCKEQYPNLMLQVEYHKRFDRAINYMRDVIESGEFGKIEHIDVYMDEAIAIPLHFFKSRLAQDHGPAEDLGPMRYIGNHFVDIIHFLTGSHPIKITDSKATFGRVRAEEVDQPDVVEANALWGHSLYNHFLQKEFTSTHYAGWTKGEPGPIKTWPDQRIKITFEDGTEMTYDQSGSNFTLKVRDKEQPINPHFAFLHKNHATDEYQCEGYCVDTYRAFLRNLTQMEEGRLPTGFPGYCDGQQALVANAFTEAVTRSWRSVQETNGTRTGGVVLISDIVNDALTRCSDASKAEGYCSRLLRTSNPI
jgi:predicted dehydrogenase